MSDILAHTEGGVCTLTFNRLDKKNSITSAMYGALADALGPRLAVRQPTLLAMGALDDWTPPAQCRAVLDRVVTGTAGQRSNGIALSLQGLLPAGVRGVRGSEVPPQREVGAEVRERAVEVPEARRHASLPTSARQP